MRRDEFIKGMTSCGALSVLAGILPDKRLNAQEVKTDSAKSEHDLNYKQVIKLITYIDSDMNESIKKQIFSKLGYECFYCTYAVNWIKGLNLISLIEFVNQGNSRHWERLEYHQEKSTLKVIGRKTPCDCIYAQDPQPPKSLCNYCCKSFLKVLFGTLLEKNVDVTVDESIILGGERCNATIRIV